MSLKYNPQETCKTNCYLFVAKFPDYKGIFYCNKYKVSFLKKKDLKTSSKLLAHTGPLNTRFHYLQKCSFL